MHVHALKHVIVCTFLKRALLFSALTCVHMHMTACARIDLKICMVNQRYVDMLSLKFEKDLFRGCGEIYVLMAKLTYSSVLLGTGHHKWP